MVSVNFVHDPSMLDHLKTLTGFLMYYLYWLDESRKLKFYICIWKAGLTCLTSNKLPTTYLKAFESVCYLFR